MPLSWLYLSVGTGYKSRNQLEIKSLPSKLTLDSPSFTSNTSTMAMLGVGVTTELNALPYLFNPFRQSTAANTIIVSLGRNTSPLITIEPRRLQPKRMAQAGQFLKLSAVPVINSARRSHLINRFFSLSDSQERIWPQKPENSSPKRFFVSDVAFFWSQDTAVSLISLLQK